MKTRFEPTLGIRIRDDIVFIMLFFMGLMWAAGIAFPESTRVAHWAHLYGFLSGVAFGYAPLLFRPGRA